ncbi:MAG: hypothetical protein H6774_02205 [Pseudomonadales bacterium]|nr:hypothetical protein [Candidatus Woesebacteria bacterium]MCB9801880.1 hypothetical protein [Pseudomonadales bacterium]
MKPALVSLKRSAVVVALACGVFVTPALAQEAEPTTTTQNAVAEVATLTAIPPREGENRELTLQPGEKKQVELRVRNTSTNPIQITSLARDFIVDEDGTTPLPVDEETSNRWALSDWLTITPSGQTIQPGETVAVYVLIEAPSDALPGGHYAMVLHSPVGQTQTVDSENESAVKQEVGTLLYVVVDGAINEQAFIRDFSLPSLSEFGPVPYSFTVENQSDIHINPTLKMTITSMWGNEVASFEVESPDGGSKNIFPLKEKMFSGEWDAIWGTGRYSAELTANYGQNGQVIMAQSSFWLLPVKLITAVLVALLALIAAMVSVRRHMLHRQDDRDARIAELESKLNKKKA